MQELKDQAVAGCQVKSAMAGCPVIYVTAHLLISGHFAEVRTVENKSNCKYYECNHCDNPLKIENRDNKYLLQLSDPSKCPNAPEDVHKAAAQAIQGKK